MKKIFTLILIIVSFIASAQTFTWTEQSSGVTSTLKDVFFADNMNGWAVGDNGTIVATTDGGETWVPQTSNSDQPLRAVFFIDAQIGWISGGNLKKALLKTINGGTTWMDIAPTNVFSNQLYDIAFADSLNGWMITRDSIYMSKDGGTSWMGEKYLSNVAQLSHRAVAVTSDSTAYVAGVNKRTFHPYAYADVFINTAAI